MAALPPAVIATAPAAADVAALDGATWIGPADYPPEARRRGMAGIVAVLLEVTVEGTVSGCTVTRSSGYPLLDMTTCRLLRERARYRLQRDEHSKPLPFVVRTGMEWRLPVTVDVR